MKQVDWSLVQKLIRFVAIYDHGPTFPARYVILGYGYGDKRGLSHDLLKKIYFDNFFQSGSIPLVHPYAGYLYIEHGEIKLYGEGGS